MQKEMSGTMIGKAGTTELSKLGQDEEERKAKQTCSACFFFPQIVGFLTIRIRDAVLP